MPAPSTKARQEVMEQLFKVNQPNISLSVPVTVVLSLYVCYHSTIVENKIATYHPSLSSEGTVEHNIIKLLRGSNEVDV